VRGLAKPVVLLSAAPFRNDLKAFRISAKHIHLYKYHEAVADEVIRKVGVQPRDPAPTEPKFCDDVISYCTQLWATTPRAGHSGSSSTAMTWPASPASARLSSPEALPGRWSESTTATR